MHSLLLPGVGAFLGNVTLLTAVVASFVPRGLGTISRDMSHLSTVETATVLGSGLVDDRPGFSFEARICAVPGNVTRL